MEEKTQTKHPIYYNVPQLKKTYTSPASVVGIAVFGGAQDSVSLRIIVKRDRSVRLSSFRLMFRLSVQPIEQEVKGLQFHPFVYDKEDLNTRDYLYITLNLPREKFKGGCTALVTDVTFENGKSVSFRFSDFEEPAETGAGSNLRNASPLLREYAAYLSAKEKGQPAAAPTVQSAGNERKRPANPSPSAVPPMGKRKKIKKSRRSAFSTPGGILVLVLVIAAIAAIAISGGAFEKKTPPSEETTPAETEAVKELSEKEVANLIAAKNFSEAYHMVEPFEETALLQDVCKQAVKHYQSVRDFDLAYLYASAAPFPFVKEVLDSFTEYFISLNRFDDAYDFLKEHDEGGETLQTLCSAAVDFYLAGSDFETAYFYAENAPQSLEDRVFHAAEQSLVNEGDVNPGALSILQKNDDTGELDALIAEAVGSIEDFETAYTLAVSVKDEEIRSRTVLTVSIGKMKEYVDQNDLASAYDLYCQAAQYLTSKHKNECFTRMISHATIQKSTAGVIFFKSLNGEDTSAIAVPPEDYSIRKNAAEVYFLLSEKQKRSYHSVYFDLYKEAYYIQGNALVGTAITDATSVSSYENQTLVLHLDGTVSRIDNEGHNQVVLEMPTRKDIVQIAAGLEHAVFLHSDGTVSGTGSNKEGQLRVNAWSRVMKVAVGDDFTVGLLADGTLIACGSNRSGQCDVEEYSRVLDIAACDQSLIILFRDGSVKVVGDVSLGLKRADYFNNVKRIRAAASCIIAETEDGTYLMAHETTNADLGSVMRWSNVRWFAAGSLCIGSVDTYGRVAIEGDGAPIKES